jgi:hypothetical protein
MLVSYLTTMEKDFTKITNYITRINKIWLKYVGNFLRMSSIDIFEISIRKGCPIKTIVKYYFSSFVYYYS